MIRWALSVIRARALRDRLLLSATAVMVLIATTLLAGGPIYSDAMSTAGMQRRIADAPTRAGIAIEVRNTADALDETQEVVDATVTDLGFPTSMQRVTVTESPSFSFPQRLGLDDRTRTVISYRQDLAEVVSLTEGRHATAPDEVVIHATAVERTGLRVGEEITLVTPSASADRAMVTIVGAAQPHNPTDPIWWGDQLGVSGVVESGGFTTLGPMWTTADGFSTLLEDVDSVLGFALHPNPDGVTPANSSELRSDASAFSSELEGALGEDARLTVSTDLPQLIDEASSGLQVSRTTVILTISQLAVLSLYALLLTAGLLVESRAIETALMRSRGVNQGQLTLLAVLEGILLVVPGLALGPFLATILVGLMDRFGPLAAANLDLTPQVSGQAFGFAAIAATLCLLVMVMPARRRTEGYMDVRSSQGRTLKPPFWQRTGLDIALVIVSVVGLWQLRRYGGTLISGASGQLRADPTLVAAPTLALIAGAVLSLRLIPLAGKLGERWARRSRALAAPLGSRQIARRPVYHTRSALLLTMATTVGFFTASFSGTWTDSQQDQADFAVPSDVIVTPFLGPGSVYPVEQLGGAYTAVDGVESVEGIIEANVRSDRLDQPASLVAVNSGTLGSDFALRPDLVTRPFDQVQGALADPTPPDVGVPLPDDVTAVEMRMTIESGPIGDRSTPANTDSSQFSLLVRDGSGLTYPIPLNGPLGRGEEVTLNARLQGEGGGRVLPPVRIVGLTVDVPTPMAQELSVGTVTATTANGQTREVANDATWEATPRSGVLYRNEPNASLGDRGWLQLDLNTGGLQSQSAVTFHARVSDLPGDTVLPAVASRALLAEGEFSVGEETTFEVEGREIMVRFVDVATEVPTLSDDRRGILVDSTLLQRTTLASAGGVLPPTRWSLDLTEDADHQAVATALRGAPFESREVLGNQARSRDLLNDPMALGIIGGLVIGLFSALAVAVIGLGAAAVVSSRQREGEFSLLSALGTSHRELTRILAIENGFTILGSLVTGIALGLGLAWLVLPSVAVSPSSVLVVPRPLVVVPWVTTALLIVSGLAVIALLSSTVAASLRRHDTAAVLRLGEDV